MNEIDNPFVIYGYSGPEYFCDRKEETVQRALTYLLDEEYIYQKEDGYIVYDRFFGMWLKN